MRVSLLTTRTMNEKLWFVNNQPLQTHILGKTAQYQEDCGVELYGIAIMGNHIHQLCRFPNANRAEFMRCANSATAKAVAKYVPEFEGGKLWDRRYSEEEVPKNEDIEEYFFYLALQPVLAGLCERLSEYPGYKFFHDAICGIESRYKIIDITAYNNAKRFNPHVHIKDYTRIIPLKFKRLPGYEHLTQREYKELMQRKLEARRCDIVNDRLAKGLGFAGRQALINTRPTERPQNSKKSTRTSFRPLVLTSCATTRVACLARYFAIKSAHQEASVRYLAGEENVRFPPGTYKPPRLLIPVTGDSLAKSSHISSLRA